ncbi:hypothetical protein IWQ60_003994 [Tieghemiomyces parasiticus]|uniref:Uncharacterized protein n=1 Tax=Tieghemiomyces parasiticus TaxID=78921 RepID=A0A9W8ABU6_9FUNG|nr:hypothetical protein IWQ60_003994 [Tieghemiomyces parasiticus]
MSFNYPSSYYTPDILAERLGSMFVSQPPPPSVDEAYGTPTSEADHDGLPDPAAYNPRRRRNGMCDLNDSIREFFAAGGNC